MSPTPGPSFRYPFRLPHFETDSSRLLPPNSNKPPPRPFPPDLCQSKIEHTASYVTHSSRIRCFSEHNEVYIAFVASTDSTLFF